jgi:hypothetical protein
VRFQIAPLYSYNYHAAGLTPASCAEFAEDPATFSELKPFGAWRKTHTQRKSLRSNFDVSTRLFGPLPGYFYPPVPQETSATWAYRDQGTTVTVASGQKQEQRFSNVPVAVLQLSSAQTASCGNRHQMRY